MMIFKNALIIKIVGSFENMSGKVFALQNHQQPTFIVSSL